MAKKGVLALMACVFALCLALVGCGGGGSAADNKAAFIGTWDLVEMSQNGEVTGSEDLETLKALGLEVYVNFNDDGTMVLALFGEPMEGKWEATSPTAGTIEMEGQKVNMSIADSKLKFEQEGASLTFQKGQAKEAPKGTAAEESSSAAAGESTEASGSSSAAAEASESASASAEASSSAAAESSSSSAAA